MFGQALEPCQELDSWLFLYGVYPWKSPIFGVQGISGHLHILIYFVIATKHGFTSVTISFQANQTAWKFQPTKKEEHVQSLQQEKEDVYISINSMFAICSWSSIFFHCDFRKKPGLLDSGGPSCPAHLSALRIAIFRRHRVVEWRAQTIRDPCRRRKTLLFKLKPGFYGGSTPSFRIKNVKTPNRMNVSHITIHQQNREKSTFEFLGGNHFWAARPKIFFFLQVGTSYKF